MNRASVLTIVGTHAGETIEEIILRKQQEISKLGYTFWLYKSHSAKPTIVQEMAKTHKINTYLINASSLSGAKPTTEKALARLYSTDKHNWDAIPSGLIVTGLSKGAFALVFKNIRILDNEVIDLWDYSDYSNPQDPVRFRLGNSTIPVIQKSSMNSSNKIKSNIRKVIAVGELKKPFCVYVQ